MTAATVENDKNVNNDKKEENKNDEHKSDDDKKDDNKTDKSVIKCSTIGKKKRKLSWNRFICIIFIKVEHMENSGSDVSFY